MKRKTGEYIILLVAMGLLLYGLSVSDSFVKAHEYSWMGHYSSYITFILQFIIYCVAGMTFGLEKFLSEKKRKGRWSINLYKLLILGIPSFLIGIYIILYFTLQFIPPLISLIFVNFSLFVNFMQMIFGYTVVTSFYKSEEILSTKQ